MTTFTVTLTNVVVTLLYILPGYVLCKLKKAVASHLPTMASLLLFVCSPCMVISSLVAMDFSMENLVNMGEFFIATFALQVAFLGITAFILKKKSDDAKMRILTIATVMGNVGFFGLPIVKAVFPDNPEVACYSCVYVISMNILAYTVGIFCITRDKKYMTLKKAILNPSTIGFIIGLTLHILGAKSFLPVVLYNAVDLLGKTTTPLCMIVLGVRLATVPLKNLFTDLYAYLVSACKLLLYPLFCYGVVAFLPFLPFAFKASILVLSAVPCASMIQGLSEIYGTEADFSANCVLLSTLLCFLTIPLLTLLL